MPKSVFFFFLFQSSHQAMMGAIMKAYTKEVVSIETVVKAVRLVKYSTFGGYQQQFLFVYPVLVKFTGIFLSAVGGDNDLTQRDDVHICKKPKRTYGVQG